MFSLNGVLRWSTVAVFVCQACQAATSATYRVSTIAVDVKTNVRIYSFQYMGQPFVYTDMSKYPGNDAFYGFVPDVVRFAGHILNVTFNLDVVKDNRYGSWADENATSWNGMIGELTRNETDVAAAALTITQTRAKFVHFSQPFFHLGLRILVKKPPKWQDMDELMVVLSPLKAEVWILTLICFLGVSVLLTVIGKFSPWEQLGKEGGLFDITSPGMTFPNSLLFAFGSLLWQGFRGTPRSVSGRTLASFWWIFAMFFLTIYGANLTAFFLTKEPLRQSVPFTTFDELSRQTDVKYGYLRFGGNSYYFKNSKDEVDRRIYEAVSNDPSLGVSSSAEAYERVRSSNGKWAYIAESLFLELSDMFTEQHFSDERIFADSGEICSGVIILGPVFALVLTHMNGRTIGLNTSPMNDWLIRSPSMKTKTKHTAAQPPCDTMVVGELKSERYYGFACRKDTTICRDLDVAILKMREDGNLHKLKWKWFSGPCLSEKEHIAMWNAAPYQDKAAGAISNLIDEKAVSLRRFGAPLILLLIGAFLSIVALGVEMVWVRRYGEPKLHAVEEDKRRIRETMDMNP